jgi:RNA polymerase sigma factor (sigma-70 family)
VDDREVAGAIAAGDAAGLAAALGEYAPGLYAYCRSQLTEPADAADALRDTFIIASAKVARLRDPGRLRAWLFAVARNECHGRLPAGVASARDEPAAIAGAAADPGGGDGRAGLRAVVRAALAALSPADGEIIELNLRHGLDGADLADVLGVPAARVPALAGRARSRFGTSLAVAAGRAGPRPCPELAAIAAGRGGALTVPLRRRAGRHIGRCPVCARWLGQLNPAGLVFLVPAPVVPAGLSQRIAGLTAAAAPGAAA